MNENDVLDLNLTISAHWNSWFAEALPSLDNQCPLQAAASSNGKELLEKYWKLTSTKSDKSNFTRRTAESLGWHVFDGGQEQENSQGLDINIPEDYARWKLNMGPGDPIKFEKEEKILSYIQNYDDTSLSKYSCNIESCTININLLRCGRCKTVYYCSKNHQSLDWKKHKQLCKIIK